MLMFVVKISLDCNAPRINKMRLEVYLIRTCVTNGGDVGKSRKMTQCPENFLKVFPEQFCHYYILLVKGKF
jgi:hypothetical protein